MELELPYGFAGTWPLLGLEEGRVGFRSDARELDMRDGPDCGKEGRTWIGALDVGLDAS